MTNQPKTSSTTNPLDYSKFDKMDFSSDEDDCHPNIEISTWRRLKERMRQEKGIAKREPELHDKWNTTNINRKPKIIVPDTDANKTGTTENDTNVEQKSTNENTEEIDTDNTNNNNNTNSSDANQKEQSSTLKEKQPSVHDNNTTTTASSSDAKDDKNEIKEAAKKPSTSQSSSSSNKKTKGKNDDNGVAFEARSDPTSFLNENMKRLKKFAKLDTMEKADKFIKQRPFLVHEAAEGYLITYAVDRAVEGADTREIERVAERCLQIHNLVQSCQTGNVKPEIGVEIFYKKLTHPHLMAEYRKELAKQQMELIQRIEARRVERITEMEDEMDAERAPLGPGGLDPTEVLNSLPKAMQEVFMTQDVGGLKKVIEQMDPSEAAYHMKRCVDAGLWVENAGDGDVYEEAHNQDQEHNEDDSKDLQEID